MSQFNEQGNDLASNTLDNIKLYLGTAYFLSTAYSTFLRSLLMKRIYLSHVATVLIILTPAPAIAQVEQENVKTASTNPDDAESGAGHVMVITDDRLKVIRAHTPVYGCSLTDLPDWNIQYEECFLIGSRVPVYQRSGSGPAYFAAGYSMPTARRLVVDISRYGRGDSQ